MPDYMRILGVIVVVLVCLLAIGVVAAFIGGIIAFLLSPFIPH